MVKRFKLLTLIKSIFALTLLVILAASWSCCKDDPVSPPTGNKQDTVKHNLVIGYDSVNVNFDRPILFQLFSDPALPKPYTIHWSLETSTYERKSTDTISNSFSIGGSHTVKAVYVDSTGSARDSVVRTVFIATPNDTSSHEFSWTEFKGVNGEANMTGCWVFGPNNILAVNGSLHHFNGTSWSPVLDSSGKPFGDGGLSGYSIFAFSENDCWLVGSANAIHYTGDGKYHANPTFYMNHAGIHSAWGTSSSDLFVVGDSGLVAHFDGKSWTKMATGTRENLYSISGTDNNNIWAAGYNIDNGHTVLLHYTNGFWVFDPFSNIPTPITGGVGSVKAFDSAGHNVTLASASFVFHKRDSEPWVNVDSGKIPNNYAGYIGIGLTGNSPNDFLCVGSWGLVIHWNGKGWKRYDQYFEPDNAAYGAAGMSFRNNTACIVGVKNGTSWVLIGQRK